MIITQPFSSMCRENEDTPSNCTLCVFLSHIHKKRPRGFYNEAKNLKISWFYAGEMREWAASKQGKQNSKTGIGWGGLIWKTRLETFILNMCCAILSLTQDFCNLLSQKVTSFRKFEVQFCEEDFSREFYCSDCRPREITTCKVLGLLSADNGAIIIALTKRTQNNNFKIYRYNFGDFTLQLASIHRCNFAVLAWKFKWDIFGHFDPVKDAKRVER